MKEKTKEGGDEIRGRRNNKYIYILPLRVFQEQKNITDTFITELNLIENNAEHENQA